MGLFLVAAVGLLVAGPRAARVRPGGVVTVRYWEKWSGVEEAQMKEIVDDFNATVGKDKGIYVEYLSMTNVDRKTLTATAAGVPPEVAGLWQGQMAQWAGLGALEPLDEMAREHGIGPAYYKKVYWDGCMYEGKLYGLISTPSAVLLHYNKDIFRAKAEQLKAAGCDPERAPRTLEELDRYAVALTERDGRGRLVSAGYIPSEPGWFRLATPLWFGGNLYDEATAKFTFTSPECVRAYEWWQGYSKRLGKDALSDFAAGFGNFSSAQNPFLAGKVAMCQQGPWMANYIQMNKPEWNNPAVKGLDPKSAEFAAKMAAYFALPVEQRREVAGWGVAPFPSVYSEKLAGEDLIDKGVAFCDFDVLAIPRGAAHKREAFEFIAYVQRPEVMQKICSLHGKNTPLAAGPPAEWYARHPNPYIEYFERMAASPRARGTPRVAVWPEADEAMGPAIERITRMSQSPAEAMVEAQERVEPKLERFRGVEKLRREAEGR